MDQTNPLAELTHKRRLSALGPGGLSRDRAGFDVRDVHFSHYGRICPIETPEGPNIGLIGTLATYGRDQRVRLHRDALPQGRPRAAQRLARAGGPHPARGRHGRQGQGGGRRRHRGDAGSWPSDLAKLPPTTIADTCPSSPTRSSTSPPTTRSSYIIAQANEPPGRARPLRREQDRGRGSAAASSPPRPTRSTSWTSRPSRSCRVATSLIPFLEHDDANRALMGSNMQRQAVPLLRPEAPLVATGMERQTAVDSGQVVFAEDAGVVLSCTARQITRPLRRRRREDLPADEVRAHQPGHLHQPAPHRQQGPAGAPGRRRWPTAPPPTRASWPWARTCSAPS